MWLQERMVKMTSHELSVDKVEVASKSIEGASDATDLAATDQNNKSEHASSSTSSLMHNYLEDSKLVALACLTGKACSEQIIEGGTNHSSECQGHSECAQNSDVLMELESSLRWAELELVTLALRSKEDLDEIAFWRNASDAEVRCFTVSLGVGERL